MANGDSEHTEEDSLDGLAETALNSPVDHGVVPELIEGLRQAKTPLTRRSLALAIALHATSDDEDAVDSLVSTYKVARADAFLGPAVLDALSVLAMQNSVARAELGAVISRLKLSDSRFLLTKAAKIIVRHDALSQSQDMRDKLELFKQSADMFVRSEASVQIAYLALADALQASTSDDMHSGLIRAQSHFAGARTLEEQRPDADLFASLLNIVLAFDEIGGDRSEVADKLHLHVKQMRSVLVQRWWMTYRSRYADLLVARALGVADAVAKAATAITRSDDWPDIDDALIELAALYFSFHADNSARENSSFSYVKYAEIANVLFLPRLGQALQDIVTRRRVARTIENYTATHGEDDISRALRAIEHAVEGDKHLLPSAGLRANAQAQSTGATDSLVVNRFADLVGDFRVARLHGSERDWIQRLGAAPSNLPIDGPRFFGGSANVDEVVRHILADVGVRLATYPQQKLQRFVTVLESVVDFAQYVRDSLPGYTRCEADNGLGMNASEHDLQDDLFRWLKQRFGRLASYETAKIGGGRADTCLRFEECTFPIEVKHEFASVTPDHVHVSYLTQADTYAAVTDRVSILVILDLRASNASGHRSAKKPRASGQPHETPSLYSLIDSFWVDGLPRDEQLANATSTAVIVGLIPGNRPVPSSTTNYSRRPRRSKKSDGAAAQTLY